MDENLDVFFRLSDFAVEATLASEVKIAGIFDQEFLAMEMGAEGRHITFTGKTSDFTELRHGDIITIATIPYKLIGIEPQGDGKITDLILKL
jgi:hypothetical protein